MNDIARAFKYKKREKSWENIFRRLFKGESESSKEKHNYIIAERQVVIPSVNLLVLLMTYLRMTRSKNSTQLFLF